MSVQVELPEWPLRTVRAVAGERGVQVWPVGGVVRDALLGHIIHDWDFVVERGGMALARAVAGVLGGSYYPLDKEHDVGRVVLPEEGGVRMELDFAAARGPDLETDLRARDFTLNAMAVDPQGTLIDPTGGLADLQVRLLRAVGPQSFDDDPLRMLRAVRLVAERRLRLEAKTAVWIIQRAATLIHPAAERVRDEFLRILTASSCASYLHMLDELDLLVEIVPEVGALKGQRQSPPHRFDVWWHSLMVVDAVEALLTALRGECPAPDYVDAPAHVWTDVAQRLGRLAAALDAHLAARRNGEALLRLVALCHDLGKPLTGSEDDEGRRHFYEHERVGAELVAGRLEALRLSRSEIVCAQTIVQAHLRPAHLARAPGAVTRRAVYRFFRDCDADGVEVVLLALADHLSTYGPNLEAELWTRRLEVAETLLGYYFDCPSKVIRPAPLLNGNDLQRELGLKEGPQVGRLLEALREAQAAGEVTNREEALERVRRLL